MDANESRIAFAALYAGLRNHVAHQSNRTHSPSGDQSVSSASVSASASDIDNDDIDENDDVAPPSTTAVVHMSPAVAAPSAPASHALQNSSLSASACGIAHFCAEGDADHVGDAAGYPSDDTSSSASTVEPAQCDLVQRSPPPTPPPHTARELCAGLGSQLSSYHRLMPDSSTPAAAVLTPGAATRTPSTLPPPPSSLPPSSPSPGSVASSAETVPPPSPAALSRVNLTCADVPAVIVNPIDDDNGELKCTSLSIFKSPSQKAYPRFSETHFRFRHSDSSSCIGDLNLSDLKQRPAITLPSGAGLLPAHIAGELSQYQRDGVTFLYRLFERGRGGLLADAMGLGKTVQTICFLGAAFAIWDRVLDPHEVSADGFLPRILVVAPASVRENWKREFLCWTPFRVALYDRNCEPEISRAFRSGTLDVLISSDHPVSNYPSFFKDPLDDVQAKWKWHAVIIDEIHIAKNANTKIYKALKSIPRMAAFGLTGTAVQNRLSELWNVLSLVVPHNYLPVYKSFRSHFIDVINKGTKKDASVYMRQRADQRIRQLRGLLSKHIVRRPKSILDEQLPGKTDYCVLMRMKRDGLQGYMYQRFQNSYDVKLLRDAKKPCDCDSGEISKECCHRFPATEETLAHAPIWRIHHTENRACERCPMCICLPVQHYSRCIAAHAFLLLPEDDEPDNHKAEKRAELMRYYLGVHANRMNEPLERIERDKDVSCKLNIALKLIKNYQQTGHKTIIFYENLRLGTILRRWATNKGLVYEVIDGSVTKGLRQIAVDRFNDDTLCSIFFISKRAGGTGLNICGADRVLVFEPCWNPTMDLQAGDRAHRLGQKRGVQMIRFVVENTIEHYVLKTAISKTQVSSAILDNTREEWRIRDDEVGSMQAMLSMGNVFTESHREDYNIVKAENLSGLQTNQSHDPTKQTNLESFADSPDIEQDVPATDILGDQVVCSLDVDVSGMDWIPTVEREQPVKQVEITEEAEELEQFAESQAVSDLLEQEGAAQRMVMTSTSARKKKRQIFGGGEQNRASGINANGTVNVNINDAKWNHSSDSWQPVEDVSLEDDDIVLDQESSSPIELRSKKTVRPRNVRVFSVDSTKLRKKQRKRVMISDDSQDDVPSKRKPANINTKKKIIDSENVVEAKVKTVTNKDSNVGGRGSKSNKPISAFAARARVRR